MPDALADSRPIFMSEVVEFGGAERSILALAHWLHNQGLPHYLLTYTDHCNIASYSKDPLTVVELRPKPGVRSKIASLRRHFAERGPSALNPLSSGYQPALHLTLARERDFHCLMHDTPSLFNDSRSLANNLRIYLSNAIIGFGFRGKGKMIVTSEYLRSECARDFGADAEIARMGGFDGSAPPRIRPSNGKLNMLSVCRIEDNKRLDWILRALAELESAPIPLSSRADWRVDFAGKGSLIPKLKELSASLGIAARVRFHGFVTDDELEALHHDAHLFLMPAIQGYGIPAIESLQRGIPVLLHRESGVSDILLDTPWATVLDGDESNIVSAMNSAIDKVIEGRHHLAPPPSLPTEDEWAERVARLCNWVE
jgi:glycosyltransferase involved in cell wall biosynthesis